LVLKRWQASLAAVLVEDDTGRTLEVSRSLITVQVDEGTVADPTF
jgi:hypothetical protein